MNISPIPSWVRLFAGAQGSATVEFVDSGRQPHAALAGALADAGEKKFASSSDCPAVAAVLTNDRPSVELFLACTRMGVRLVSLPLLAARSDPGDYVSFVRGVLRAEGIGHVIARNDLASLIRSLGQPAFDVAGANFGEIGPARDAFELVQFSSGSTADPKGILLSDKTLGTNVAAILERTHPTPGDTAVSWLPISHDMGLVGILVSGIAAANPVFAGESRVVLTPTELFVRAPANWSQMIQEYGASFSASPDFGLRLALLSRRSATPDLRSLRNLIVGGETVRASTLRAFADRFPIDPRAICPAYGMAELGLAASISSHELPWTEKELSTSSLTERHLRPAADGEHTTTLVSCGPALSGYRIRQVTGHVDEVGELVVSAPSLGRTARDNASLRDENGDFRTGDLGFVRGGEVYVCGRIGDYISSSGRNIYTPAIERAVAEIPSMKRARVVCLSLPDGTWGIAVEAAIGGVAAAEREGVVRAAALSVSGVSPDEVRVVPRHTIPLTPSGKIRRQEAMSRWLDGRMARLGGT